ncbi:MAG: peptidyl-tRNA hydrolase Pth2 [Candidatus Thorarchaeota archaeon SMTZ1-83]|nr:MAG: peptidyl-tRNA hydrolase [Candidatus Thorarchaeota archaeon SMTZ1-83]
MSLQKFKFKQIIAVRTDLGMSKGKMAVQVAHGAVSASERVRVTHQHLWKAWFNEGQKKVVVKVASEEELLELRRLAVDLDVPFALIRDAGMTELPPGTTTVIAVGPGTSEKIDRVTGELKLL